MTSVACSRGARLEFRNVSLTGTSGSAVRVDNACDWDTCPTDRGHHSSGPVPDQTGGRNCRRSVERACRPGSAREPSGLVVDHFLEGVAAHPVEASEELIHESDEDACFAERCWDEGYERRSVVGVEAP